MKRVLIAAVFLTAVIIGSCFWMSAFNRHNEVLLDKLDRLSVAYQSGSSETDEITLEITEELERIMRFYPMFIRHTDLHTVEQALARLPDVIYYEDSAVVMTEINHCRHVLIRLSEEEKASWRNVF